MSLTDYSDLEKEIKDAPEPKILSRGDEVKARIIAVQSGEGEYGRWYRVSFDVPSEPTAFEFSDFFSDLIDAKKNGNEKQAFKAFKKFQKFAAAFGIDYSKPFSWDDLVGSTGWIILGVKKSDEYGDQNTVSRYVSGKGSKSTKPSKDDIPF